MDNQHKLIKGYRDLSQVEIDLINEIKSTGNQLASLIERLRQLHVNDIVSHVEQSLQDESIEAMNWLHIGEQHLKQGIMALTRSVAKPQGF